MINIEQVNRLGFEAYADNLIVNALEEMRVGNCQHYHMDKDDLFITIRIVEEEMTALVRAYVPNVGW